MTLRPYQSEAVEAVYEHLRRKDTSPCVVLPTGTGKSLVIARIAKDAAEKWNGRVLILAHVKELLEQNADKIRRLCPELDIGVYSAGLNRRDTEAAVIVAGIQSVYSRACELGAFDLVIVDECFSAGTLIDTPRGEIPIEDLYVGQPVRHACGVGNITAISSRPATEIIRLELSNGKTVECTPNHPFFTRNGWRPAGTLEKGALLYSREDVRKLRGKIPPEMAGTFPRNHETADGGGIHETEILFAGMPQRVAASAGAKQHMETPRSDGGEELPMLRERDSSAFLQRKADVEKELGRDAVLQHILCKEGRESDVSSGNSGDGRGDAEEDRFQAANSRRERNTAHETAERVCGDSGCGNGISGGDDRCAKTERRPELLQTGCGDPCSASGNTAGRRESQVVEKPSDRQEGADFSGGVRVVSAAHIKLQSPRIVYNLQVEGHPSYYADGVLVHNCHLIPPDGEGMYRTFLNDAKVINPHVRLIGLTATPYRLKGGLICKPENLLNEVCYEAGLKEMIQQGYLAPLVSRAGRTEANLSGLHIRGGEFIGDEIAAAMDKEELVSSACREIAELARSRKSVLIFTAGVEHCRHVAEKISEITGEECAVVTGDTPAAERAEIIARFKREPVPADLFGTPKPPLKYLCNVNVLTTGFDAPNTDCIAMLRPTNSPGLLVQCAGRGTRLSPETGKSSCLFLDYGGNILRHGPLDMIRAKEPGSGKGGDAPAKKCPECFALIHAGYAACPECGYVFPRNEGGGRLTHTASSAGVISGQAEYADYEVLNVYYRVHEKRGADFDAPKTVRVDYQVGFNEFKSEWICPEHTGYARGKFEKWWRERAAFGCPMPDTAGEAAALAMEGLLAAPEAITVKTVAGERFERITGYRLKPRPVMREPGDDREDCFPDAPAEDSDDGIPF